MDAGCHQPVDLGGDRVGIDSQLFVEVGHDRGVHALHLSSLLRFVSIYLYIYIYVYMYT